MNYTCICCGTCCQKYQPRLTRAEVKEIAAKLNITPEKLVADYTDHRWPGTESFLLAHNEGSCIFLETCADTQLSLCRIHSFKPASCRNWEAGIHKPECQAGLKRLFGVTVDAAGQLEAREEQMGRLKERIRKINEPNTSNKKDL